MENKEEVIKQEEIVSEEKLEEIKEENELEKIRQELENIKKEKEELYNRNKELTNNQIIKESNVLEKYQDIVITEVNNGKTIEQVKQEKPELFGKDTDYGFIKNVETLKPNLLNQEEEIDYSNWGQKELQENKKHRGMFGIRKK